MRSFVDYYGILAVPMALLFAELWRFRKQSKIIVLGIVLLALLQNNFFLEKYKRSALHYDSMTKAAFWKTFWQTHPKSDYWDLLESPDYEKALQGIDATVSEKK